MRPGVGRQGGEHSGRRSHRQELARPHPAARPFGRAGHAHGHHLFTLSEGGRVRMEMTARRGRAYVPAERNKVAGAPIGIIPIDSLFSPIKKVNYQVTNARVGQVTDYDRLSLEVWTNGSVSP